MNEEKIMLTTKDILEKEFKIDTRGYRPQEVDQFLDLVMADYREFNKIINRAGNEIKTLLNENNNLKAEIRKLQDEVHIVSHTSNDKNVGNTDILKRIGELEKIVFGEIR